MVVAGGTVGCGVGEVFVKGYKTLGINSKDVLYNVVTIVNNNTLYSRKSLLE